MGEVFECANGERSRTIAVTVFCFAFVGTYSLPAMMFGGLYVPTRDTSVYSLTILPEPLICWFTFFGSPLYFTVPEPLICTSIEFVAYT
jgi:hypothetical protein